MWTTPRRAAIRSATTRRSFCDAPHRCWPMVSRFRCLACQAISISRPSLQLSSDGVRALSRQSRRWTPSSDTHASTTPRCATTNARHRNGPSARTSMPLEPSDPGWSRPMNCPPGCEGLSIQSRLNGSVMQSANTADMAFGVARTIALLSESLTLEPGDVIAMGTPGGVGYARNPPVWLKAGDSIEIEIEGIGVLRNPVTAKDHGDERPAPGQHHRCRRCEPLGAARRSPARTLAATCAALACVRQDGEADARGVARGIGLCAPRQ